MAWMDGWVNREGAFAMVSSVQTGPKSTDRRATLRKTWFPPSPDALRE